MEGYSLGPRYDHAKIQYVIRETLNGIRNLTTTREVGSQNVGT